MRVLITLILWKNVTLLPKIKLGKSEYLMSQKQHLLMYMKPPIREAHKKPTTTTASGLTGARFFHQPVLNTQVYMEECPFSYTFRKQLMINPFEAHVSKFINYQRKQKALRNWWSSPCNAFVLHLNTLCILNYFTSQNTYLFQ